MLSFGDPSHCCGILEIFSPSLHEKVEGERLIQSKAKQPLADQGRKHFPDGYHV